MLPVEVAFISYDPRAQLAVVFLREMGPQVPKEPEGDAGAAPPRRLLPIWIGLPEANAIYLKIEGKEPLRPFTHDLMATILSTLEARVLSVTVHSLEEFVFHGRIEVEAAGKRLDIDARPSDAIALALRMEAGIFVEPSVMDESAITEADMQEMDKYALKHTLESLDEESYEEFKV